MAGIPIFPFDRTAEVIARVAPLIRLAKVPLCLLIWCSAIFGFALSPNKVPSDMILAGFGVFLLAAGGATLNSLQEYVLDSTMSRTRTRPLVLGQITKGTAAALAPALMLGGLVVLFLVSRSFIAPAFGLLALLLYNGVYTPLKKSSIWAIVPGALCGALPPYIGWLCGGGEVVGYIPAMLISLLILWQVPHFWLVLLRHKHDYLTGELPSLLLIFEEDRLKRFFVTWISGLAAVMLMFLVLYPCAVIWQLIIVLNCAGLVACFVYLLFVKRETNYRLLFAVLNVSILVHMVVVGVTGWYR